MTAQAVLDLHAERRVLDSFGVGTNWRTGETSTHETWRTECAYCRTHYPCATVKALAS